MGSIMASLHTVSMPSFFQGFFSESYRGWGLNIQARIIRRCISWELDLRTLRNTTRLSLPVLYQNSIRTSWNRVRGFVIMTPQH